MLFSKASKQGSAYSDDLERIMVGLFLKKCTLIVLNCSIMTVKIEKEKIGGLHFIAAVPDQTAKWKKEMDYAVRLGNEHKGKTAISFVTEEGTFQVETTVWSATEKEIQLKGGVYIPLKSITDMHF